MRPENDTYDQMAESIVAEAKTSNGELRKSQEQPMPLPDPLPSVPPFDLDLLPNNIRPWVEDHADALQCPPEYVAVGAMVALAGTIGRQVAIAVKQRERWIERCVVKCKELLVSL